MLINLQNDQWASAADCLREEGYCILPTTISDPTIEAATRELAGLYRYNAEDYNLNNRVENAWEVSPAVKAIACDPSILAFLDQYFGEKCFPFQTLNFEKGSGQKLHSDFYHFASSSFWRMVGVWVALEDIDSRSGPLEVVPGSHRLPYFFPEDCGSQRGTKSSPYEHYQTYENFVETLVSKENLHRKRICLDKGEVLVWHSNLFHGGSEVADPSLTRLSQVTHYFSKGHFYFSPIRCSRKNKIPGIRFPQNILNNKRVLGSLEF